MSMGHAVGRLLLHLGEHIANNLGVLVGRAWRARGIDSNVAELRPRERVIEVVLEEVVLGQVLEIGVLDEGEVGGFEETDVHFGQERCLSGGKGFRRFVLSVRVVVVIPRFRAGKQVESCKVELLARLDVRKLELENMVGFGMIFWV
jgi:hypothetical protein